MSNYLYNILYIGIICVQGFKDYPMYIVFKDIFIFRCVFWANQEGIGFGSRL